MVEVKAGQWWMDKGSVAEQHRILVRGLTSGGKKVIVEWNDEEVSTLDLDYFLKFKEHLPECTSFDWVPEVYPQYRETFQPEEFAFVRLNDKNTFTYVRLDGKEDPPSRYGYAWETINDRPKLTEVEALAKIVKPEPKVEYPIYWTTTDTGQFAYYLQTSATHGRCVFLDGRLDHEYHMSPRGTNCRTRLTEEQAKALIQKPEPKTRTVKVHTVLYTRPFGGLGATVVSDESWNEISKNWKNGRILKTEEFEVPCE